jgi:acetaldehyde dehydrogenase
MNNKNSERKARVAILGTGKIGIDLLVKVLRSKYLVCSVVAGRHENSQGMQKARELGVPTAIKGIESIVSRVDQIDVLFDATSAFAHVRHWEVLESSNLCVIDMTPSQLGEPIVPAVNLEKASSTKHVNMISCGGQASIPIIHAVSEVVDKLDYVEVVSSIASKSAGAATRINLDEYIQNTEQAIRFFSKSRASKVILILNPAEPPVDMQTTISFQLDDPPIDRIVEAVRARANKIREYVPGYEVLVEPKRIEKNRVVTMIKVVGRGDYLPRYAGNLDVINCAAVAVAEKMKLNF